MMGRTLRLLLPMWAAAAGVIPALAQVPFSLDTSFRTMLTQQNVNSMAVLANGDLLLSGQMRFPGDMSTRYLAKVDTDGNQVASFPFLYGGARITPWNGQYYVSNTTVRRLLPDGLIDPSFIQMNSDPLFNSLQGGDYHVYPDGRILMSGTHTLYDTVRGFTGNYDAYLVQQYRLLGHYEDPRRGTGRCSVQRTTKWAVHLQRQHD
ncbi:MAG: hypothetical protein IPK99_09380 [Flavobacteriales bacterium]|nr:hypothetical protein [Flavobacteriales bacterium]